jgi:hypothetical protein
MRDTIDLGGSIEKSVPAAPPKSARLIRSIAAGFAPEVANFVKQAIAPLVERIAQLEARPTVRYLGTWTEGTRYGEGAMVTDHGSVWACEFPTTERPGSSPHWVLAVKRGRDGKDAGR